MDVQSDSDVNRSAPSNSASDADEISTEDTETDKIPADDSEVNKIESNYAYTIILYTW